VWSDHHSPAGSGLDVTGQIQRLLFDGEEREKQSRVDVAADQIKERFGAEALRWGSRLKSAQNKSPQASDPSPAAIAAQGPSAALCPARLMPSVRPACRFRPDASRMRPATGPVKQAPLAERDRCSLALGRIVCMSAGAVWAISGWGGCFSTGKSVTVMRVHNSIPISRNRNYLFAPSQSGRNVQVRVPRRS
jgi:hypothetical protein